MVDIRALSASHADRANGQNGRSKRMSKLRSKRPSSDNNMTTQSKYSMLIFQFLKKYQKVVMLMN